MAKDRKGRGEPFVLHSLSMLESPAWRHLPQNARRVVERLELEHLRQGGAENGNLKCTYDQFAEEAGIRRPSIALAIRQSCALGWLEVTREGGRTGGDIRIPSTYRLTHVWNAKASRKFDLPTDEWKRFVTDEDALAALKAAEKTKTAGSARSGRGKPRPRRRADSVKLHAE